MLKPAMEFEWDEVKREANLAKHGIDFVRAATMWTSPVIEPIAERAVDGELRRLALGVIGNDDSSSRWCIRSVARYAGSSVREEADAMSEHITRISLAEAVEGDRTDWTRVGAVSDAEIEAAIAGDPDALTADLGDAPAAHYAIYRDSAGQWRWRLIGRSGHVLARSGGAFASEEAASIAVATVRTASAQARAA